MYIHYLFIITVGSTSSQYLVHVCFIIVVVKYFSYFVMYEIN